LGWRSRVSPIAVVIAMVVVLAVFLTLYPTVMLLRGSLSTGKIGSPGALSFANYTAIYSQLETYRLLGTTALYAVGVAVTSVAVGFVLAWISVRTDAPLATRMPWLIFIPYALPATLTSVAWTILANPSTGLLNQALRTVLGSEVTPFNIYSFAGMIFVAATYSVPLAFTFLTATLHSQDPALEEVAGMSGAGPFRTFRRITVPLARPAIFSVLALLFILGLESFDVPAFLGIPANIYVFTTAIFIQTSVTTPPNFGQAAAYGALPLLLAMALTFYYQRIVSAPERFATISGKAYRPRRIALRGWRWLATTAFLVVFVVGAVLPLLTLFVVSLAPSLRAATDFAVDSFGLQHYAAILGDTVARRAIRNSLVLAVLGATLAVGASFLITVVMLRTRVRGRAALEYVLFLPFAFPSIVLAVGIIWGYVSFPIEIYGTIWIMLVGYVTKFLPYGLRSSSAALVQIDRELVEAAHASGATLWPVIRRVLFPLALPGLVAGWSLLVVVFLREFSMSLMLWSSGSEVVTVLFWDYWSNGQFGRLGALGILLITLSLGVVFGVRRVARLDTIPT